LKVVGTENKDEFITKFAENKALRKEYKLLGTHSDTFHCDEVMATSLLQYTEEFKKSIIVRTRDQTCLDMLDAQCDVGGIYDAEKRRFDHHQKTFTNHWWEQVDAEKLKLMKEKEGSNEEKIKEMEEKKHTTKMSSAGLVYKHYGREIIKNMTK